MNQAYKDFIQYSLDENKSLSVSSETIDWQEFMKFCYQHSIIGIVFEGLERSNKRIPQKVLFEWISYVETIKKHNQTVDKRVIDITKWFDKKGIRSIILKGQANGLMYPKPELRSPGDIDVWVDAPQLNIIKMVLEEYPNAHYSLHHIKMPVFNEVSVEIHYKPIYLTNWFKDRILQKHVDTIKNTQFSRQEYLKGNKIGCLTDEFNVVYQLLHMYAHFFSTRNNFKQLVDYYYLLKLYRADVSNTNDVKNLIKELGLLKYAKGIMWIMKEILGLDEKLLYLPVDEKIGKRILEKSMRYGTYSQNKLTQVLQQFCENIRLVRLFPSGVLISPLFLIWHQYWRVMMKFKLAKR